MRDYEMETTRRVAFIQEVLSSADTTGIVYGSSGGKDSALVGILCKLACSNTMGIVMPCGSMRNYGLDKTDAETIAAQYHIETRIVDLTAVREALLLTVGENTKLTDSSIANIAPRLRMITLYAVAASEGRLVAGTGNRSEEYMGYFTKWGDGAYDFNPIADLTVTEIYEFLHYLEAPEFLFDKAPSAGLFDGQTDEGEMGVAYHTIDQFLLTGAVDHEGSAVMERHHKASEHKRNPPLVFKDRC